MMALGFFRGMRATDFEVRHQTLLHMVMVGLAFLTYAIAPDDIVWLFVKDAPHYHLLERSLFAMATLLIGVAAAICTWTRAYPEPDFSGASAPVACDGPYRYLRYPRYLGTLFYAVGLGSLAPLPGFIILVAGDALLVFRLIRRTDALKSAASFAAHRPRAPRLLPSFRPAFPERGLAPIGKEHFARNPANGDSFSP